MPNAIGLRIYRLYFSRKGSSSSLSFRDLPFDPLTFVNDFVAANTGVQQNAAIERSWFLEAGSPGDGFHVRGLVHYGTYGYASTIVDMRSRQTRLNRSTSDVEQIPLYYDFWFPQGKSFALVALSSFAARSCVLLIMGALSERLERLHDGLRCRFQKLMPNDAAHSLYANAAVKRIRLVKKGVPSDFAERYASLEQPDTVDIELSIKARSRKSLGRFSDVSASMNDGEGVAVYDGLQFDEAIAEINVGGRRRRVGVFGHEHEAGMIDVTDSVVLERGHPTFESMAVQSSEIMVDFYRTITGQ